MEVKVHLDVKDNKPNLFIETNISEIEEELLKGVLVVSFVDLSYKIEEVNRLGYLISSELHHFLNVDSVFLHKQPLLIEDINVLTEQYLQEVANFISEYFAQLLSKAIDLPEINETIAEVKLPDNVIAEFLKRNTPIDYKATITLNKKLGFNDFFVIVDKFESSNANKEITLYRVLKEFDYLLKVNYDNYVKKEMFSLIPGDGKNHDEYRIYVNEWSKEAIEKQAREIKARIMNDVNRIINTNTLNLAVTALYPHLFRSIKVEREDEYVIARIYRRSLLSPIELFVCVDAKRKEKRKKKYVKMTLNVSGVSKEVVMYHDSEEESSSYISFGYNESAKSGFLKFENRDVTKDRLDRIRKGDFSVIDEAIKENEEVIESITRQLQEQKIEYIDGNYNMIEPIQININVLDLIPEKQRQELVTYLVAEKIKRSVQQGG